jgi:hypothetical protein
VLEDLADQTEITVRNLVGNNIKTLELDTVRAKSCLVGQHERFDYIDTDVFDGSLCDAPANTEITASEIHYSSNPMALDEFIDTGHIRYRRCSL